MLSLADVRREWNSNRWRRNSIRSEIGIFLESKTVPVRGPKRLPHDLHRKRLVPDDDLPSETIDAEPQWGHDDTFAELTKAISSGVAFPCFFSYHSLIVDETSSLAGLEPAETPGVPQREPPARVFLLHFSEAPALGGLPRELLISQTRELPKGLFQRDFPAARIIATSSPLCT